MTSLDTLPPWVREMLEDLRERAAASNCQWCQGPRECDNAMVSLANGDQHTINWDSGNVSIVQCGGAKIRALPLTPESAQEKEPHEHLFIEGKGVPPYCRDCGAPAPPVEGEEKGTELRHAFIPGEIEDYCYDVFDHCGRPASDHPSPSPPNAEQGEDAKEKEINILRETLRSICWDVKECAAAARREGNVAESRAWLAIAAIASKGFADADRVRP